MNLFEQALFQGQKPVSALPGDEEREDGLLVCGQCGVPKETWFEVPGVVPRKKVPCMCRCEEERQAAIAAEQRERREEERKKAQRARLRHIDFEKWAGYSFDSVQYETGDAFKSAKAYADQWDWMRQNGAGLMLYGSVGSGKTYLAACIANHVLALDETAAMLSVPSIIAAFSQHGEEAALVMERVRDADLLVLDDLGAERATGYAMERIYDVVNSRLSAGKPLVCTTNLSPQYMYDTKSEAERRIYSRVLEACVPVLVVGISRKKTTMQNLKAAKEKLGIPL